MAMKQGIFYSDEQTLKLNAIADANGSHEIVAILNGGVKTEHFEAVNGMQFEVPNVFPETGVFNFDIRRPNGTYYADGSTCGMYLETRLNC